MADDPAAAADEMPRVTVHVGADFQISRTPVTRTAFAAYAADTGFAPEGGCWTLTSKGWRQDPDASWMSPGFDQTDAHPVTCVSYKDAQNYAAWLSRETGVAVRLPTEAEWRLAAGETAFWDQPESICVFGNVNDITAKNKVAKAAEPCTDGYMFTSPVGSFAENPNGLFDVIGNVWEWTSDCHRGRYDALPADAGPSDGDDCDAYALRGHSWTDAPGPVRLETRLPLPPDARQAIAGFRLVRATAP